MRSSRNRSTSGPSGPMQGQSIFRVPNYKSQMPTQGPEESADRVFHSRRSHRKSRAGCVNCKQRRVKCDETKPHCLRCGKLGVECNYSAPALVRPAKHVVTRFIESNPDLISADSSFSSMSLLLVAEKLDELLRPPSGASSPSSSSRMIFPAKGHVLEALHHFHRSTITTIHSDSNMCAMMRKVAQLAFETPLLMHAIIGVAISHLCNVLPDNSAYRLAEAYHWQETVNQYSKEISSVNKNNMDKLFSTCILLTIRTFMLEEFNPRTSFVFSNNPADLNWLLLQGGLRFLLERTGRWLPNSMWWSTFMETHDSNIDFEDTRPGRVDLNPDFADLCGIAESSTTENNPYLWPLRMLTILLTLEPGQKNKQKYGTWMGRLEPAYLDCLLSKEPPALVLLAWWLALMSYLDEWWAETRVRSECTAICIKLEDSDDPILLKLLEFPAQRCGYLLRHVQEQAAMESGLDVSMI